MTIPKWSTTATLSVLLALGNAVVAMQGSRPEWKIVPTMPPGSWYRDDGFEGKAQEAEQAAIAAKHAQDGLNSKIREQFDKMDMMEKGQRMQAWMMKNPQAASKMLEASADGGGATATAEELQATAERLDKELEGHKKAFDAAVDAALKPVLAKEEAYNKAKGVVVGEAQQYVFTNDADYAGYVAIVNEQNAAYEKAAAPFYGANGVMYRWLQEFRSEVTEKALAAMERGEALQAQQFAIMDTPSGGYRSSSGYDAVRVYLRNLSQVASHRRWKAKPTIRLMKRDQPEPSALLEGRR